MKADLTRDTFIPSSHRRTVRYQQGRIPLDAELNEAQDLLITRVETEARDVIGQSGAPQDNAGFEITVEGSNMIVAGPGRYYVDGILCELAEPTPLNGQANLPGFELPPEPGLYLAMLDVSFDHLTALEDPRIQEIALHGADTTTRQRVKPQVRLVRVNEDPSAEASCDSVFPAWDAAIAAPTGSVAARAEPEEIPANECSMTPGAGYRALLNQLYRVEIHAGGDETEATFKWSRENGSIVALWESKTGNELTVSHQGRDPQRLFRANGWIELIDRERELREEPGTLVRVSNVRGNVLTIDPTTATGTVDFSDFETLPRVRRWESAGALELNSDPDADGFSPLEYGVQLRFGPGTYRTGDYWLIPARAATGDIEWARDPATNEPLLVPRHGVEHHYARLALLRHTAETWTVVSDCRKLFPPLTELDKTDLKLHNKHLHGSGVVCGLQVYCDGPERIRVRIRPGHAIDCEGTDILLHEEHHFGVVELAGSQGLLNAGGNGEVLVTLVADPADRPVFGVRAAPDDPETLSAILRKIIEGTLWWDFYHDCLKPLLDSLRDFIAAPGGVPANTLVSVQQQRLLTIANLLAHRRSTSADHRLWLSAEQHAMLQQLYERIIEFAGDSKTFCAIASTFPNFPSFPFTNRPIRTAFAAQALRGVRVAPGENPFVFAWSDDEPGHVFIFEGNTGKMLHNLSLPGAGSLQVRDVTVAQFGNDTVAVVGAANADQTVLSLLRLGAFTPVTNPVVLQGGTLTRLETHSRLPSTLLALQPGKGIHFLDLNRLSSQNLPAPAWAFNAAGHLSVMDDTVCATSRVSTSVPQGSYDALRFGRLSRDGNPLEERDFRLAQFDDILHLGEDGVALVPSDRGLLVHAIVNPETAGRPKSVLVADAAAKRKVALMTLPLADTGAGSTGPVAVAAIPAQNRVAYALAERNQIVWANAIGPDGSISTTTIPAQSAPIAIATSGRTTPFFAVAHRESMTVTLVPINLLGQSAVTDAQLAAYRDALMTAFEGVLRSLLQGLKDCLCDHLLLNCPECGKDEFLTLAKVDIRARQVHHICNFDRDEVLTFPKVKYWLSALPIIPAVSFLVEKFCCWIIPAPVRGSRPGAASAIATNTLLGIAKPGGFEKVSAAFDDNVAWAKSLGRLAADRISPARTQPVKTAPARTTSILGRDTPTATAELEKAGVAVARVSPYNELLERGEPLREIATLPAALKSGDRVELFVRDGEVAFFRRIKEPPSTAPSTGPAPSPATPQPSAVDPESLDALRRELSELKASHASDIAARDAAITALKASQAAEAAARTAELAAVKQAAEADRRAHDTTVAELRAANSGLQQKLSETGTALRRELESTTETLRQEIARRPNRPNG